ncbi:hypothetical protein B484DRAFT_405704 [Ochromonadaceae sp. CCMP2298]|nr:hypothetical protein B484DRAFT_405704 [Ochromonadaceae sp. CCMP2298]
MTSAISRKVMDATEMEPTYKTIETQVSSLGLYLLLEQVCTKNSVNNVEMLRTKLMDHHYEEGDCVYAFITELDALFKSIDMASGADGQIRDHDKVYRLREALPKNPLYKTLLIIPEEGNLERLEANVMKDLAVRSLRILLKPRDVPISHSQKEFALQMALV